MPLPARGASPIPAQALLLFLPLTCLASGDGFARQTGWPQNTGSGFYASPAIADVDGDGLGDLVAADVGGNVHVWRHDGSYLPGWPRSAGGGAIFAAPAVGDVDGDGDAEVVVTTQSPPRVVAFHHDGAFVTGFPRDLAASPTDRIFAAPALGNLDMDPALEIVAATDGGLVAAMNAPGGAYLPGWPKMVPAGVRATPVLVDLDLQGFPDVIVRQTTELHAFGSAGIPMPGWPRAIRGGYGSPAAVDLNLDAGPEVLAFEWSGLYLLGPTGSALNRRILSQFTHFTEGGVAVGDLTADPGLEIVFAGEGGWLYLVDALLNLRPGWPVQVGGEAGWSPILADLDGDHAQEIVVGTDAGEVKALRPDGTLFGAPLPVLPGGIRGALAAGDLDGDPAIELAALDTAGNVYVFEYPGPWAPFWSEWPQAQSSERRDGAHRSVADLPDADGDNDPDLFDCAPNDPAIHHRAEETCNGLDDDCSGVADDVDADGDGFFNCTEDCDDGAATTYPGAPQLCDGVNNDCSDPAWPTPPPGESDADFDTWRICAGDCDDTQAAIRPGGSQLCGDGLNNDCGHPAWPALTGTNEVDDDLDTLTECGGDCDDGSALIYPGAPQICGDTVNNDCLHPAWPVDVTDTDDDADGLADCAGDCDDGDAQVFPGAAEICDGKDSDCSGGIPAVEADADGDTVRVCAGDCDDTQATVLPQGAQICGDLLNNDCLSPGWPSLAGTNDWDDDGDAATECSGDCNDLNPVVYPGAAQVCGDGVNNDCLSPYWPADPTEIDDDGDGLSECLGDCDDGDSAVLPGRPEICDGKDSDCDGSTPEEENDLDGDTSRVCEGDCDDALASVRPGGAQVCGDGLNNDCLAPEWPSLAGTNEFDDDGDAVSECSQPADCDDANVAIYPGAEQVCGDGVNNDCLSPTWPLNPLEVDADHDGFTGCNGTPDCDDASPYTYPGAPQVCGDAVNNDCLDPAWPGAAANELDQDGDSFTPCGGDCDDTRASVFQSAPQICGDGLNNSCNHPLYPQLRGTNEGDDDGDGLTECGGDCDDTRGAVYPGAAQVCDGVNNDCLAPGWPALYGTTDADDDGDGWSLCEGDCDTLNAAVYPGATQRCGDGVNNDCLNPQWPVDMTESDDDGDGQTECSGATDCNDADGTVYAFAPQVCGDGKNNDCRHPSWPLLSGTNETDDDGDTFTECSLTGDCSDANAAAWATPGEATDLLAFSQSAGSTALFWSAPAAPGGTTVVYDVLRSTVPWDFAGSATCLETGGTDRQAGDPDQTVPTLHTYFYLVRPRNACPGAAGVGVLGRDSSGGVITGRTCP